MKWRALACLLAACSAAPHAVGSEPSWRRSSAPAAVSSPVPVPFTPTTAPAQRYNEPTQPPPHTPLGDAMIAAIADAATRAHVAPPVPDARLFRACAELAAVIPQDRVVDYSLVEFALHRNGIIEPSPPFYSTWSTNPGIDDIVTAFRPAIAAMVAARASRFGIGEAERKPDGTVAITLLVLDSNLVTSPIPETVGAHDVITFDGSVAPGYRELALWLGRADGSVDHHALALSSSGSFKATVPCGSQPGRQQVEIEAVGPTGPTTLANFPVWCGVAPPSAPPPALPSDAPALTASQAEQEIVKLINADRRAVGLPALTWDDRVAAVARSHSEEMKDTQVVAHDSPRTGTGADRLRAAGIRTRSELENVGRGHSVAAVHAAFMASPSHRAAILSPVSTHVGIGIVYDQTDSDRVLYVTEMFIRVRPRIDPGQAADLVAQRIIALRPVAVDPRLRTIAQSYAEGLAAGKSRDELAQPMGQRLDELRGDFKGVRIAMTVEDDLASIDGKQLLGDGQPSAIGVGVAQGHHPELGDNAIWIVVLMAEPRAK